MSLRDEDDKVVYLNVVQLMPRGVQRRRERVVVGIERHLGADQVAVLHRQVEMRLDDVDNVVGGTYLFFAQEDGHPRAESMVVLDVAKDILW